MNTSNNNLEDLSEQVEADFTALLSDENVKLTNALIEYSEKYFFTFDRKEQVDE